MNDGDHHDRLPPIPDPTPMTTAQLKDALASLREILETKIEGQRDLFQTRIDGMDKAVELLQERGNLQPAIIDAKIGTLRTLHEEKFDSVQKQFQERDTRTEQQAIGTKLAVDAALQAVKEAGAKQQDASDRAIAKSEVATTKQLDGIGTLISANTKAFDDKIVDLKDRVVLSAGKGQGATMVWMIGVAAIGVVASIMAISAKFDKPPPPVIQVIPPAQVK